MARKAIDTNILITFWHRSLRGRKFSEVTSEEVER